MASTYTANLKLELIPTGSQAGIWGATTNVNLGSSTATQSGLEQAIVGKATLVTADFTANVATYTLSDSNAYQVARAFVLDITATLTAAGTVNLPSIQKPYLIFNNSVGGFAVTVKVTGLTGISIPNGKKAYVYTNSSSDITAAFDYAPSLSLGSALLTTSGGTGQIAYTAGDLSYYASGTALTKLAIGTSTFLLTSSGTAPQWTNPTSVTVGTATTATNIAGGAANRVVFQSGASTTSFVAAPVTIGTVLGWTGTAFDWVSAPAASTATNLAGGTAGDIVYQSGVSTSAFLSDIALGNALITGGVGVAPSYGKIGLTTHVSGTLPIANGGTNSTDVATAGGVGYGTGTAHAYTGASTAGFILTSGGAGAPAFIQTLPVANGGTGANTLTANNVILGNGTSAPLFVAPGSSGNLLTSNGTTWASTAPAPSGVSAIELFYYANT